MNVKIKSIIENVIIGIVGIISAVAGLLMLLSISAIDSNSNIPLITLVCCLAWFGLLLFIADIIKIIDNKRQ